VRIIVVGGAGTIGKAAVKALSDRHEIAIAGRRSGTVHVDIRSPQTAGSKANAT
jgi:nucleoside-diphosphate-sugar epimerase